MKRAVLILVAAAACLFARASLAVNPPGTALPPPSTGGLAALDPLVAKLTTHRRLLIVAAHPDDEDTALLTLVALALERLGADLDRGWVAGLHREMMCRCEPVRSGSTSATCSARRAAAHSSTRCSCRLDQPRRRKAAEITR